MKTFDETIAGIIEQVNTLEERTKNILEALKHSMVEEIELYHIFYAYASGWYQVDPQFGGGWAYGENKQFQRKDIPSLRKIYDINKEVEHYCKTNNIPIADRPTVILKEKSRIITL